MKYVLFNTPFVIFYKIIDTAHYNCVQSMEIFDVRKHIKCAFTDVYVINMETLL